MNNYDVIIAGGGIAGLTAAAYCCDKSVLLCEKSSVTGGLIKSFNDNGFVFDAGVRSFENSGIIFPMLKQLGINIDFIKSDVSIGVEDKIINYISKENLYDYGKILSEKFPENAGEIFSIIDEIKKITDYMSIIYGIDNPLFLDYMNDKKYMFNVLFPWLIKYSKNMKKIKKLDLPVNDFLRKFTSNEALIDVITQHFFHNTPTFFALSYFGLYLDYYYPLGGTYTLVNEMEKFISDKNVTISKNTEISEIFPGKNILKTSDGKIMYFKKLIWAADIKSLYNILNLSGIKNKNTLKKFNEKKKIINEKSGNESILTVFISSDLNTEYFEKIISPHFFYTPTIKGISGINSKYCIKNLIKSGTDNTEKKDIILKWLYEYLRNTTYEISVPSMRDKSLSPKDKTGIIVSTLIDYNITKFFKDTGFYEEFKNICTEKIIQVISENLFKDLPKNIIKSSCATPLTLERYTSNFGGSITGWSFDEKNIPSETNLKKISKSIITPFSDIYQAGQWSFSPSGLPVSILTGKLAADKALKSIRKEKI